jgi:hypothetical protein
LNFDVLPTVDCRSGERPDAVDYTSTPPDNAPGIIWCAANLDLKRAPFALRRDREALWVIDQILGDKGDEFDRH